MHSLSEQADQSEQGSPEDLVSPSEVDFAAVARVSTQAELQTIQLAYLHADIDQREVTVPSEWSGDAFTGFVAQPRLDREKRQLLVYCTFVAVWAPGLSESEPLPTPKEAPFELTARFALAYGLRDPASIQDCDPAHFATANSTLHAWPYWRELAHSTTVRMGLAPLLIGTFKVPWTGDPDRQTPDEPPPGEE